MMKAEANAAMDMLLVCALTVTLLGIAMSASVRALSRYLLRWRPRHSA